MRKNNLTRKGIISVLLILILTAYSLSSCSLGFGTTISKMDDSINKKYQDILKELDNDVLSAIHNNDSRGFNDLISHELRNTGINIESFTAEMGEILKDQELSYLKRYHSKLRKIGNHGFTIMSPSEDEMFVARISGVGNEVLVSFRKTMTGVVDYALNTIYIKEKGEWKIGSIHLCAYSVQDKSALELYGEAKTLIEQGYTLPAFFMYILWNQVSALGDNFQYKNIVEMREFMQNFYTSFVESADFPIEYDGLDGVSVINLNTLVFEEGIYPQVIYMTDTSLDETDKIENEAAILHENLINEFLGMGLAYDTVIYSAYNEYPIDPEKMYNVYGTHIDLTN